MRGQMPEAIRTLRPRSLPHLALVMTLSLSIANASERGLQRDTSQPQESGNHTWMNADLAQAPSLTVKVATDLPDFVFKVTPDNVGRDENGNTHATVRDIEVFRGDSKQSFQHLTGCNWSDMEPLSQGADWFRAEDVNFDGYKDIYVMTWWGATGNQGGCWWLYSPSTGRFEHSKEFSQLSVTGVNPDEKTLLTFSNGGAAGQVHDAHRYRVENSKPVLIWHEHQDWDTNKNQFHCVVEERRKAKMVTVRDEWGKPNDDGPCDPGRLFQ